MPRFVTVLIGMVILVGGCSSGEPTEFDISYTQTFATGTGDVIWVSSGPAVDEGAICPEMTMRNSDFQFENPDGSPLDDSGGTEPSDTDEAPPFVRIGEFACVDGSGVFTLRSLANAGRDTWKLTGGEGYEDVSGQGQADEIDWYGDPVNFNHHGTGIITAP